MKTNNLAPPSITDHIFHYMVFEGITVDQAISKVEGDLRTSVPEHVKIIAKKELENIGNKEELCQR